MADLGTTTQTTTLPDPWFCPADCWNLPPYFIHNLNCAQQNVDAFLLSCQTYAGNVTAWSTLAKALPNPSSDFFPIYPTLSQRNLESTLFLGLSKLNGALGYLCVSKIAFSNAMETSVAQPLQEYHRITQAACNGAREKFNRCLKDHETALRKYCSKKKKKLETGGSNNSRRSALVDELSLALYTAKQTLCKATLEYVVVLNDTLSGREAFLSEKFSTVASLVTTHLQQICPLLNETQAASVLLNPKLDPLCKLRGDTPSRIPPSITTSMKIPYCMVDSSCEAPSESIHTDTPGTFEPQLSRSIPSISTATATATTTPQQLVDIASDGQDTGSNLNSSPNYPNYPGSAHTFFHSRASRSLSMNDSFIKRFKSVSSIGSNSDAFSAVKPSATFTAALSSLIQSAPALPEGRPDQKQKQGYLLMKPKASRKGWIRQYFYIQQPEGLMMVYTTPKDYDIIADVKEAFINESETEERCHVFEVNVPGTCHYCFQAESEKDMRDWIKALNSAKGAIPSNQTWQPTAKATFEKTLSFGSITSILSEMEEEFGLKSPSSPNPPRSPNPAHSQIAQSGQSQTPELTQTDQTAQYGYLSVPVYNGPENVRTGTLYVKDTKSKSSQGGWRRAFCTLKDDGSFTQLSEMDNAAMEFINIREHLKSQIQAIDETVFNRKFCFSIAVRQGTVPMRTNYYMAETMADRNNWISCLKWYARSEGILSVDITGANTTVAGDATSAMQQAKRRPLSTVAIPAVSFGWPNFHEKRDDDLFGAEGGGYDRPFISAKEPPLPPPPTIQRSNTMGRVRRPSVLDSTGGFRLHRTFWLRIIDGRNLPSSDAYCEVMLDNDRRARTSTKFKTSSPFWREDFVFDDLPQWKFGVTILIMNQNKIQKDAPIGRVHIPVRSIRKGEYYEGWYPVTSNTSSSATNPVAEYCGDVRLKLRFDEEVVLDSQEYEGILSRLLNFQSGVIYDLANCAQDLEVLAQNVLHIYEVKGQALAWIKYLTENEVSATDDTNILFRGNSILTKAIDAYMKMVGMAYLDNTVGNILRAICDQRVYCEVDPSRLEKGDNLAAHWKSLMTYARLVWKSIEESKALCPRELQSIFSHLQRLIVEKYAKFPPERHGHARYTCVSGFIFLRFFCPAILSPKLFGLVPEHPDARTHRTLTLLAKSLQCLGNLATFGVKEPYMVNMNEFLMESTDAFMEYIDHISSSPPEDPPVPPPRNRPQGRHPPPNPYLLDLDRELARLSHYVILHGDELRQNAASSGPETAESRRKEREMEGLIATCRAVDEKVTKLNQSLSGTMPTLSANGESSFQL